MDSAFVDIERVERHLSLQGCVVLEVGCGNGRLTKWLGAKTERLVAIDSDMGLLTHAKTHCAHLRQVSFCAASGESLGLARGAFDVVLFAYSLHHQDSARALVEASRVLTPHGVIVILEPTVESEYTRLVTLFEPDEPTRLRSTLSQIESGLVVVIERDRYVVEHHFAHAASVYRQLAQVSPFHGSIPGEELFRSHLGPRSLATPVIVRDDVRLFVCRPCR